MRRRRRVAIEFGMCRSGRIGGVSGFMTVGNGRFLEARGGTWSRGGNRLPFGDQESVGRDAQGRVVLEASPDAPLVMTEPAFRLQFLVLPPDAPATLGEIAPIGEGKSLN